MTLTEYLERGYPIEDFAENLESVLLNFGPYAETRVACHDRAELDQVLDVIEGYFQTLHLGFQRPRYTAIKKPDWFYIYRSGEDIHMGGGNRNGVDFDESVTLSEILVNTINNLEDVEVCDNLPELDSLFS